MERDANARPYVDRRRFLQSTVVNAVLAVAAPGLVGLTPPPLIHPAANPTPDEVIRDLLAGNERFAANRLTSIEADLAILKAHTVDKQEPLAAVLACADSRVPVELVFDQSIGHLFVTRVAGNIATPEIIASLEYAVAALGVRALVVLGHSNCGAVKAALKPDEVPGQISALYQHLRPAVDRSGGDLNEAINANARIQAELVSTSSTVVKDALGKGALKVVSGVYDLKTGKVSLSPAQ